MGELLSYKQQAPIPSAPYELAGNLNIVTSFDPPNPLLEN